MGLRVLVADDEADILEVIEDRLAAHGFTVVTAATGAEAFKKIRTERFDGVFLDVKMPEMTGIELQRQLSAAGHRTPIIFMTADDSPRTRSRLLRAGAIGCLTKPLSEKSLLVYLRKALDR